MEDDNVVDYSGVPHSVWIEKIEAQQKSARCSTKFLVMWIIITKLSSSPVRLKHDVKVN